MKFFVRQTGEGGAILICARLENQQLTICILRPNLERIKKTHATYKVGYDARRFKSTTKV